MNYAAFKRHVHANRWTLAVLRCDVPPSPELLDFMARVGLDRYERFVLRYERETPPLPNGVAR